MQPRSLQSILDRNIHPLESALFDAINTGTKKNVFQLIDMIEERAAKNPTDSHGPSLAYAKHESGLGFLNFAILTNQLDIAHALLAYFCKKRIDPAWSSLHLDPIWLVASGNSHAISFAAGIRANKLVTELIECAPGSTLYFTDGYKSSPVSPFDVSIQINRTTYTTTLIKIVRFCDYSTLRVALSYIATLPYPTLILNQQDSDGCTALHCACDSAHPKKTELLIRHGASLDIAAIGELFPLDCIPTDQNEKMTIYLRERGALMPEEFPKDFEHGNQDEQQLQVARILAHGKVKSAAIITSPDKKEFQNFYYPFTSMVSLKEAIIARLQTDDNLIDQIIALAAKKDKSKLLQLLPKELLNQIPYFARKVQQATVSRKHPLKSPHLEDFTQEEERNKHISLLIQNHEDLTLLHEQLSELSIQFSALYSRQKTQQAKNLHRFDILLYSFTIVLLAVLFAIMLGVGIAAIGNDYSLGVICFVFDALLAVLMIYPLINVIMDHACSRHPSNNYAKCFTKKILHQQPLVLPVSFYDDLDDRLHELIVNLESLYSALGQTQQKCIATEVIQNFNEVITQLKEPRIALRDASFQISAILRYLKMIDETTIQLEKKPLQWQFFKKHAVEAREETRITMDI